MDPMNTPGAIGWYELTTPDVAKAKAYYAAAFGWTYDEWSMGEMTYTLVKTGETSIGGMLPGADGESRWVGYVTVADLEATVAAAKAAGGTVAVGPTAIPTVGTFAVMVDPLGATLAAIQYEAPAK